MKKFTKTLLALIMAVVISVGCIIPAFADTQINNESAPAIEECKTHKWELTKVVIEPTCMTEGSAIYTCSECNETLESVIAKLPGHGSACQFLKEVTKATCTTDGIARYNCTICEKTFDAINPNDLKRHGTTGWTEVEKATAQTCTTNKVLATDKYCDLCGVLCKSTGVAYTETELKTNAAKHNWIETTTPATCISAGSVRRVCTCGAVETEVIPAKGHTELVVIGTPATCKTEGITDGIICTVCNAILKTPTKISTVDHIYEEYSRVWTTAITTPTDEVHCGGVLKITSKCACGDVIDNYITYPEHEFDTIKVTEPTCVAKGYSEYVCKYCGIADASKEAFDKTNINTNNHALPEIGKGIAIDTGATCLKAGKEIAKCADCDYSTTRDVPATGHTFVEVTNDYYANPTAKYGITVTRVANTGSCLVKSEYDIKCKDCDEVKRVVVEDGTGTGHSKTITLEYKAPTCATSGNTEGWYCSNQWCGYSVTAKIIPAIHFDVEEMTLVEKVDATCFADGNIEYYICPLGDKCISYNEEANSAYVCDKNLNAVANTVIEQLTHQPIKGVFNAATCSNYGYRANVCGLCDNYIETTNFTPMAEHKFGEAEIVDSCEEGKKVTKVCLVCDYKEETIERPAGHTVIFNGVANTLTSFCGDANATRTCSTCGTPVVKNDHTFGTPALVDGMLKYICEACGYAKTVEHDEHVWVDGNCICGETAPAESETVAIETETETESETAADTSTEDNWLDVNMYWFFACLAIIAFATVALFTVNKKKD